MLFWLRLAQINIPDIDNDSDDAIVIVMLETIQFIMILTMMILMLVTMFGPMQPAAAYDALRCLR